MKKAISPPIIALLLVTLVSLPAIAKFPKEDQKPRPLKAILVQLNSETAKIDFYTKNGDAQDALEVKSEAAKARKCMINDFKDHFSFCTVYYFMDTNINKIKAKQFEGVLLNADGSIAKNLSISPADSDYNIVYYGYNTTADYKCIVALNDKYEEVFRDTKFDYFITAPLKPKYCYISSKYSTLEYYPLALSIEWHANNPAEMRYDHMPHQLSGADTTKKADVR